MTNKTDLQEIQEKYDSIHSEDAYYDDKMVKLGRTYTYDVGRLLNEIKSLNGWLAQLKTDTHAQTCLKCFENAARVAELSDKLALSKGRQERAEKLWGESDVIIRELREELYEWKRKSAEATDNSTEIDAARKLAWENRHRSKND